jgi:hypothetical protein
MVQGYITKNQVRKEFWFDTIQNAALMNSQCLQCLGLKLTISFELIHNKYSNPKLVDQLFSVYYFGCKTDNSTKHSKTQDQTLNGTAQCQLPKVTSSSTIHSEVFEGLPEFLYHGRNATKNHNIIYHKGFISYSASALITTTTPGSRRLCGLFPSLISKVAG